MEYPFHQLNAYSASLIPRLSRNSSSPLKNILILRAFVPKFPAMEMNLALKFEDKLGALISKLFQMSFHLIGWQDKESTRQHIFPRSQILIGQNSFVLFKAPPVMFMGSSAFQEK